MRKRFLTITLLTIVILSPTFAFASFQQEMNKMFGSMTNVTSPTAYMDQSRGVYSGGSVVVRNPIVNAQLVNFQPPSMTAGCGGIDMFGGSFSFISADQFVSLMRAIGSNAVGYSFDLALKAMCPSCEGTMKALQADIQKMNSLAKNSCEAAQKGLTYAGVTEKNMSKFLEHGPIASINTAVGGAGDFFGSFLNSANSSESNSNTVQKTDMPHVYGNIAWKVITGDDDDNKSALSWFDFGDVNFAEMVMSLTGTVIVKKYQSGSGSSKSGMDVSFAEPTIHLSDIMGEANSSQTVTLYTCVGESASSTTPTTDCTDMAITPGQSITTMVSLVKNILEGDGTSQGLAYKFTNNTGPLTNEEKAFMQLVPSQGKRLHDLAIYNPGAVEIYADKAIDNIALDLTRNLVNKIIDAIRAAAVQNPDDDITKYLSKLDGVQQEINEESSILAKKMTNSADLATFYDQLLKSGENSKFTEAVQHMIQTGQKTTTLQPR